MEKNIKDYLHLYLGCECQTSDSFNSVIISDKIDGLIIDTADDFVEIKPILRPLSDMTEAEAIEGGFFTPKRQWHEPDFEKFKSNLNHINIHNLKIEFTPDEFVYLLSKHFDLYELIEAGLAIDKTTIK